MNLYTSVNNVLKRLDDYPTVNGEQVWTRAEVELYLKDGYRSWAGKTQSIFDFFYAENVPAAGNYGQDWELGYFDSGMIAIGLLNYSGGYWERDYSQPGAVGPVNSTQPWEAVYLTTIFAVGSLAGLDENVAVDRVTHDWHTLNAEFTTFFQQRARNFQTVQGDPWRFSMDKDGINNLRVVPAGSGNATQVDISGTWGLLRAAADADGMGAWTPMGSWGCLREVPQHFPMGAPWGVPRRLYSDVKNTRVEFFRLGRELDEYDFEMPDRFVKYVEFFAQAKCLERDGPGQDLTLSQHFMQRYEDGAQRMIRRLGEMTRSRLGQIGGTGKVPGRPALAQLPWRYGRQIRSPY